VNESGKGKSTPTWRHVLARGSEGTPALRGQIAAGALNDISVATATQPMHDDGSYLAQYAF
jgi:hypothetical protein